MKNAIDTFVVNKRTYHITQDEPKGAYNLWAGGCGIGHEKDRETARKLLLQYIISHLRAESASYRRSADAVDMYLNRLVEGDILSLGRFMQ